MNQNILLPKAYDLEKKIKNRLDKFADKMNGSKIMQWIGFTFIENLFYIYLLNKYKSKCLIRHNGYIRDNLGLIIHLYNEPLDKFEEMTSDVVNQLTNCIKRGIETIIIPLTLRFQGNYGHANVLIYRKNSNSIEHFEPYGNNINIFENGKLSILDSKLKIFIDKLNAKLKREGLTEVVFESAVRVCPNKKGLQALDQEIRDTFLDNGELETRGYCVAWSMFFTELALQNPEFTSGELLTSILKSTSLNTAYIKKVIRGYVLNISEKLEKYFTVFFGRTANLQYIYEVVRGKDVGKIEEMRQYINQIIDIELLLLNDNFDKEAYMRNIEEDRRIALEKDFKVVLKRIDIQKKILENIHIIEDANRSVELEDALKPIDINSPEGKARNLNTARSMKPKKASRVQKECPEGKVRNPETGRCITLKNSRKKKTPVQKECPEGKERNPETRRCMPPKNSRKKKTPVQKECPEGKERNPKTRRCIKKKSKPFKTYTNQKEK